MKRLLLILFICSFIACTAYCQSFSEVFKAAPNDRAIDDEFGQAVDMDGDYAIVGADQEDEDEAGNNYMLESGSAYIYERDGFGNWSEAQKIVASDRAALDYFGNSVSISGNYAIVGAHYEDEDVLGGNTLSHAGSAYIYERDGTGTWNEVQKLVASDRDAEDWFGYSVAINGDYAIVGAHREAEDEAGLNTISYAGSAYIFERDGTGTWNEVQKIVASDRATQDYFGQKVAISGDYAVINAWFEDEDELGANTLDKAGSCYIFERDGTGTWNEVQKIVASDRNADDMFGFNVDIDGTYLIASAHQEDEDVAGTNTLNNAGSAYIFERDGAGVWVEVQKIVASDRGGSDRFGSSVTVHGNFIAVGAVQEDQDVNGGGTLFNSGSAYVFMRDGTGTWSELQKIVSSDRANSDLFGHSIAMGNDATIIVGTRVEDEDELGLNTMDEAGSAYIFGYSGVGIHEQAGIGMISVSPNPSKDLFTADISDVVSAGRFRVLDLSGRVVQNGVFESYDTHFEIDGSLLARGAYILVLSTQNAVYSTKLIRE